MEKCFTRDILEINIIKRYFVMENVIRLENKEIFFIRDKTQIASALFVQLKMQKNERLTHFKKYTAEKKSTLERNEL